MTLHSFSRGVLFFTFSLEETNISDQLEIVAHLSVSQRGRDGAGVASQPSSDSESHEEPFWDSVSLAQIR